MAMKKLTTTKQKLLKLEVARAIATKPAKDQFHYVGIAKLFEKNKGTKNINTNPAPAKTFHFMLVGDNGEPLMNQSQPYNTSRARRKTLERYFSNFLIVDK